MRNRLTQWKDNHKENVETYLIILGGLLFFNWQSFHLGGLRWDYDEGVHLAIARLLSTEASLYVDIPAKHPPLFFYMLSLAFKGENPIYWGRLLIVFLSTIGLLSACFFVKKVGRQWTGLICMFMLCTHPHFLLYSRVMNGNLPSLSLAMFSLMCLAYYGQSNRIHLLALSGVGMGLALLMKLLPIYLLPLPIFIIFFNHLHNFSINPLKIPTKFLADVGLWIFLTCVVFITSLLPFNLEAAFEHLIAIRFRSQTIPTEHPNWWMLTEDLIFNENSLTLLAFAGVLFAWKENRWKGIWAAAWLGLTIFALLFHSPLWPHFFVTLTFPIAIAGSIALEALARNLKAQPARIDTHNVIAVIGAVWFIVGLPFTDMFRSEFRSAPSDKHHLAAIDYIANHTDPELPIITDEQILAIKANRLVPPQLADTSMVRIVTEPLTSATLIAITKQVRPSAIVFGSDGRFITHAYEYCEWVAAHFQPVQLKTPGDIIFIPPVSNNAP